MITEAAQAKTLQIGKYGCYFLCLLKLAEKASLYADVLYWYDQAEQLLFMGEDPTQSGSRCFVFEPGKLLSLLMSRQYAMSKQAADYATRPGELEVLRYEIPGVSGHFVIGWGNGTIQWDPMEVSNTAARGKLVSKRIFTEVG